MGSDTITKPTGIVNMAPVDLRPETPKVHPTNPCLCEECVEKDGDGKPIIYFLHKIVARLGEDGKQLTIIGPDGRLLGDTMLVDIPGTAYYRNRVVRHWYCDACHKKNNFPGKGVENAKLPRITQYYSKGGGEVGVNYFCGRCGSGGVPEHNDPAYR